MSRNVKPSGDADRRKRDLAAIHAMRKELALSEDCYRSRVRQASGDRTDSAGELTAPERTALINQFRSLGAGRRGTSRPARPALTPQQRMVRGLWIALAEAGAVEDRSERGLAAWLKARFGVETLQWLQPPEAGQAIEQLKKWGNRVGEASL